MGAMRRYMTLCSNSPQSWHVVWEGTKWCCYWEGAGCGNNAVAACAFRRIVFEWQFAIKRFLESLIQPDINYAITITAFWTIEAVYQQSFAYCLEDDAKTPAKLREACERWGNEGFGHYCDSLREIADRCLSKVSEDVQAEAEATFLRVLKEEVEFWNMSQGWVAE